MGFLAFRVSRVIFLIIVIELIPLGKEKMIVVNLEANKIIS